MNVKAVRKGKNKIGPLEFYLNKTKYTTNSFSYEVVEPLPKTDKGVWFRKVMTSDGTFSIIVEQRFPAKQNTINPTENSFSIMTEAEHNNIVKFKYSYSIDGVTSSTSSTNTNYSSIEIMGEQKQFMFANSIYHFNIIDKKARIKVTKDLFINLPADYTFTDIVIQ